MRATSFEKFCLASCLSLLVVIGIGQNAEALTIGGQITDPKYFKLQLFSLLVIFTGLKLLKRQPRFF